jgi:methionyl-tRNA synthetase
LPDVPANEFLNLEGNKLSTSKNWAVWLHEYLEDFGQQDVLRYAHQCTKLRIMILLGKIFGEKQQ